LHETIESKKEEKYERMKLAQQKKKQINAKRKNAKQREATTPSKEEMPPKIAEVPKRVEVINLGDGVTSKRVIGGQKRQAQFRI